MQFSTHTYEFTGYQNYEKTQKKIETLLTDAFEAENYRFLMAVNEAVCNAARYSLYKPQKARITIEVRVMNYDVAVKVSSPTSPFRAEEYQKKLRRILDDKKVREMEWGDYLGFQLASAASTTCSRRSITFMSTRKGRASRSARRPRMTRASRIRPSLGISSPNSS